MTTDTRTPETPDTNTRTVLLPLDGSEVAESAIEIARRLASCLGAQIVLLRAALAQTRSESSPTSAQREVSRVVSEARQYLAAIEERLRDSRVLCRSVVPYGPPADAVIANAELQGADLVVMSAHGATGPSRWNHGGVADKIVQGLSRPVLLVQGLPVDDGTSRILLPLDGSELAETILDQVAELARCFGSGITLLTVLSPDDPCHPFSSRCTSAGLTGGSTPEARATSYLEGIAAKLRRLDVEAQVEVVAGAPADEILRRSALPDVSLVAVSAHGLSGIGRWVYGSVATKVLHQSSRPVLLYRSPASRLPSERSAISRRCHNCGRPVYRHMIAALDVCPLCGFPLRVCANCLHFDGVVCDMDNPWEGSIYAHNPCEDFAYRETSRSISAARGR
jgi:nucleotide-binding universal stress UspA family protein